MKRLIIIFFVILVAIPIGSFPSSLERGLKSRWLGAWVLTTVETYSACSGRHTSNRVNGRLVSSKGRHRFHRGELARVERVDVKRRRIDLYLSVVEPLLVPHRHGPFTLYNEVACKIELEVEVPRELVKAKDAASLDRTLAPILERFADIEGARRAASWNERERAPFPDDYERTLARHAIWQAEQNNALVQARMDEALRETSEITARIGSDPAYLSAFANGVQAARDLDFGDCSGLLAIDLSKGPSRVSRARNQEGRTPPRTSRGYRDGEHLVLGLEMLANLPECFVSIPELPEP